jgi:glycosyltransferase involved in cell wall biosynthesis
MFSIIIPTFNNLNYLKLCLDSIKKNSSFNHEIIIHVNEGTDGTLSYLREKSFKKSYSEVNEGVCVAFNKAVKKASKKFIVLAHDDMYFCPNWDKVFENEIKKISNIEDFFLSGTMIQPFHSYINLDCGKNIEEFNEKKLLSSLPKIKFKNFQGSHWQPSLIPINTWNKVGGFSEEFSPGLGSDPDFNFKLWNIGVRLFKGLGDCRVYHFSSLSLRKKVWNNGAKTFLLKWGITIKFFKKYYLRSDEEFFDILKDPKRNFKYFVDLTKCKIVYFYHYLLKQLFKF